LPTDIPVTDLASTLLALLARTVGWLAVAALIVGVSTSLLAHRRPAAYATLRTSLFGAADERPEFPARRFLRIGVGAAWIIDGLLQAQPHMPAGFVPDMITPGISASPSWLGDLVHPLAVLWSKHPVTADATTVWIQVGLGVLILIGGRGRLAITALWASIGWSLFVWVTGEFLGGLLSPGASWLVGAPGSVLVYALAALLLLAPVSWWESGRGATLARRAVAGWFLIGALLQAIPWEGSWSAAGMSAPFADGSATSQPSLLRRPIESMTALTRQQPALTNAILIAVLLVVAIGLWLTARIEFIVGGLAVCAATWWLAQDFGVLGGVGTDPNTALPLALVLASALPQWNSRPLRKASIGDNSTVRTPWFGGLRQPLAAAVTALGIGAALVVPLAAIATLAGPADASAVAADSGGGVLSIPDRPAPPFSLTDQDNRAVSSTSLHGKLTLVTFLDPVCSDDCPIIANQLAIADRELGALADEIQIVAIDSNPLFPNVADVAAFTTSHGLATLPNWHFLAGPVATLQDVAADYGIAVQVPTVGMIEHGEGIYFLAPDGAEVAYLGDGANDSLTGSYADAVRNEVRRLLA
jgi:cytochrome oxidase Cu insertion factor (SCO1/SenC/PrrC family)